MNTGSDTLREDDIIHPFHIAKALGLGRLGLTLWDGLDASPDHLGHIRAVVDAEGDGAGGEDTDAVTGKGQSIIQKAELQQHRGVLDELHINTANHSQRLFPAGRHQAEQDTQGQCQKETEKRGLNGGPKTQKKALPIEPDLFPGPLRKNTCHVTSHPK